MVDRHTIDRRRRLGPGRIVSYLTPPRVVFSGTFVADVSTVNNDPEHFDTARFNSSYWDAAAGTTLGWWNPGGTGTFGIGAAVITSATNPDGATATDATADRAVGMTLSDGAARTGGRMVDLDSENQLVSEIWGWSIVIADVLGNDVLTADYEPSAFMDLWMKVVGGNFDSGATACWQSHLSNLVWGDTSVSPVLDELRQRSADSGLLSMKFMLDSIDDDPDSPLVTVGRLVGSIGTVSDGEPRTFIAGRQLDPLETRGPFRAMQSAPVEIVDGTAWLDLGNSLPITAVGGPAADIGNLILGVGDEATVAPILPPRVYTANDWYEQTAGIVAVELDEATATAAQAAPLWIAAAGNKTLAEPADGLWLRTEQLVMRLDPDAAVTTTMFARRFGAPAADIDVSFGLDNTVLDQQRVVHPDRPGPMDVGAPANAVLLPTGTRTGRDGTATITVGAADPGNPRSYIDGQVYQVTYGPGSMPPPTGSIAEPSRMLNLLVWSGIDEPTRPSWVRDIAPIFTQYASLYPVMKPIIDLADYSDVHTKRDLVRFAFSADVRDPRYMPVTRDLSAAKRRMILRWLDDPILFDEDDPADLRRALQMAIELEHATIPPYLTALFSMIPGTNRHVALLLSQVVAEEMGHMVMAANLLVAIGGAPQIGRPGFIPRYPGPVPGGLAHGLTLRLRRLSVEQIRDVFLPIERPSKLHRMIGTRQTGTSGAYDETGTIEGYYAQIERSLEQLALRGAITFGHADRQITDWMGARRVEPVVDLQTALHQLRRIVREGAGKDADDPTITHSDGDDAPLGHYFRFTEIVQGKTLTKVDDEWRYEGDVIPLDPADVLPMIDDPLLEAFPVGSRARLRAETFHRRYHALLGSLHEAFNGSPDRFDDALALMHSIGVLGRRLAATPLDDGSGRTAGPVF